jgi:hypothetical protein
MGAIGGDITELTYNHPTIGQGSFFPKANEGNTIDPGGFRANDDASMISGDGQIIDQINRVRGSLEVLVVNDQNVRNDLEVARLLAASPVLADWTASHINGTVWGFKGKPVGDLSADTNAATFNMKIATANIKKIIG